MLRFIWWRILALQPTRQHLKWPWENCSRNQSLKFSHQIKHTCWLLGCEYFLCWQLWWLQRRDPDQIILLHLNSVSIQSLGSIRGPLCPFTFLRSPDKFEWVPSGSRISCLLVDDPKFYSVGEEVILETWFQEEVPGLLSLDIEWVILSQKTGKILFSLGA